MALQSLAASAWRFLVTLVVSAIVLWIAQKIVLPGRKEQSFVSVLALAFVWSIIDIILGYIFAFLPLGILEWIIELIIWIWILKAWFDVGWLTASVISIVAWIISMILGFFLGILSLI